MIERTAKVRGRPPKGPKSGKGSTLATRVTAETRRAVETEAERTGRSISQVAELWLEQAWRGQADYLRRMGGDAQIASAFETLIEVAQGLRGVYPNKELFRIALSAALEEAIPLLFRRGHYGNALADITKAGEVWDACEDVLSAIQKSGVDDPVFRRAGQPLLMTDNPLIGERVVQDHLVLALKGDWQTYPGREVIAALEQLQSAGPTASREIGTALKLAREFIERRERRAAAVAHAERVGRAFGASLAKVSSGEPE